MLRTAKVRTDISTVNERPGKYPVTMDLKHLPGGALSGAAKGAAAGVVVSVIAGKEKKKAKKAVRNAAIFGGIVGALKRGQARRDVEERR